MLVCSFTIPTWAIRGEYTGIPKGISVVMDDFTHEAGDPSAGVLQGDRFRLHRIHPESLVVHVLSMAGCAGLVLLHAGRDGG